MIIIILKSLLSIFKSLGTLRSVSRLPTNSTFSEVSVSMSYALFLSIHKLVKFTDCPIFVIESWRFHFGRRSWIFDSHWIYSFISLSFIIEITKSLSSLYLLVLLHLSKLLLEIFHRPMKGGKGLIMYRNCSLFKFRFFHDFWNW